jgi:transcriptional regulator with XRE-family HTH domain
MNLRNRLGFNVRRLRKERDLSQERLSVLSGLARAYVSSVETGRRNATLDTLEILARTLGVNASELVALPTGDDANAASGQRGQERK